MKAQYATTRMVKGRYGRGVGNESEYGDKARFEARKQVKREGVGGFGVGQVEDEETWHGCRYRYRCRFNDRCGGGKEEEARDEENRPVGLEGGVQEEG